MNRDNRLKKNWEFQTVYRKGESVADKWLVLYKYYRGEGRTRVGFSVSRKVGKSVVRNRVRRLLRESYRLLEDNVKENMDLVFVARTRCRTADFKTISNSMTHLLKKANLLRG